MARGNVKSFPTVDDGTSSHADDCEQAVCVKWLDLPALRTHYDLPDRQHD
ncbi:MAG: hypothetical protein HKN81_07250 [Gammaproteobacteria bacterium]|nr:hypothetical protein [Gammaproteobacteria bacterium]